MPEASSHRPGSFCWCELGTSDWQAAKQFYTGLFGWTTKEVPMAEGQPPYVILLNHDLEVGALSQRIDVPPNWGSYVAVASADETAARAKSLGATVIAEPFDVFESGRMAVLQDLEGAIVSIWQARDHIGARIVGEPGSHCWSELYVNDLARAKGFYTGLFGWTAKESPEYTEWMNGSEAIGGMMKINPEWGNVPPHWMVYFAVTDCDGTVKKAEGLGGRTTMPPMDVPNVGRFAMIADPQGAVFSVIKLG